MTDKRINFVAEFDDSQVTEAMDRIAESTDSQQSKFDDLAESGEKAFSDLGKSIADNEKKTGSLAKRTAEYQDEVKDAARESQTFSGRLKGMAREIKIGNTSLGDMVDNLKAKQAALRGVVSGIGGANKMLRLFKVALISTGIGAILVALGSLVALLTRTQKGIDFVNRIMAGLGATIDVVIDRFSTFGAGIVKLFRGDLSGAVNDFRGAVSGLGEEIRNEVSAAVDLEKRAQNLRDATRELNVETAKRRAEIAQLRFLAEDETRAVNERTDAIKRALSLEEQLERQRINLAKENLSIIEERNALGESLDGDLRAAAQAEIELENIRAESAQKRRSEIAKLNSILRQEAARVAAIRNEYFKFLDDLEQKANAARIGQLLGLDRLQAEKDLALQEVENFRDEIIAAATRAGIELPESFKDDIAALVNAVEAEFKTQVDKLREGDTALTPLDVLGGDSTDFEQAGKDAIDAGISGMEQGVEDSRDIITRIRESILVAFNITGEELQFIGEALGSTFDNVLGAIDATTEAAINQQDKILSAIESRIQETQQLLSREEQRQKDGFANDVSALKEKLAAEQEEREKAELQRLALEKKAANQRLLQNSLEQGSNFILAVTRMIASQSFGGIAGIFTAIAGVALITRIIAQAKSTAQQFEPPQFREGTPFVLGPSHEKGGRLVEVEGGERIFSAKLNARSGGSAISNEEFFRLFEVGKLMESINRSPLPGAVSDARRDQRRLEEMKVNLPFEIMERTYQKAADKAADKMIDYWKTRPVTKPTEKGEVTVWQEGLRIERHFKNKIQEKKPGGER